MTATHKPGKRATASDKDATLEQLRSALEASQREKAELLIENGRLRGQQAASGEILGIIARGVDGAGAARGVGGAQDVLDAIAQRASGLVRARSAVVVLVEGDLLRIRAAARGGDLLSPPSGSAGARQRAEGQPLAAEGPVAAAVRERRAVHVPDIESAAEAARYPSGLAAAREVGFRSVLSVPLLRGESAIGAIALTRAEPEPFTDDEIALIHTFADQAVIAIENARLFQQLQDTNRTLTERTQQLEGTLAQQTATSDVLRVIASSPNDRRAALEAVVERAARLCGADNATVRLVEGDEFVVAANYPSDLLPGMIGRRQRLGGDGLHERALRSGRTVHLPDTAADPLERHRLHRSGQRTAAAVPLLREGIPVGVLNARRTEQRPFTDLELAALETFAAQAAIAVETTRLFGELRERDDRRRRELERAAAIQQRLLPSSIEGWPGVLEIAHRFRPAVETSGDFFDVLPLTPSRPGDLPPLQVAVGDVAGKGKSAALVTALARSALHAGASVPTGLATPATTLRLAGQRLHRDVGTGHFVACALAVVEPPGLLNAGPLLRVSNAAQVPVLLCRAGTSTEIEPPGDRLPLGARADGAYRDADVELRPGDTVVFSSDGLVEAPSLPTTAVPAHLPPPDHPGAFFGFARFAASATHWSQHAASAEDIAAGIWSDLTAWCGDQSHQGFPTGDLDDMTLLVLRVPRYPPGSYPGYDRAGGRARAVTDLSFRL